MSNCQYFPYHLYSSAVRSTAIEKCVSGHFTSETDLNLIIAKNSRLEIFSVGPEGLTPMKDVKLFGRVAIMFLYRAPKQVKDFLFILTSRYNAMVLETIIINDNLEIHTRAHGNLDDRYGKISEKGIIAAIEPYGRLVGLRLSDGLLKILPLESDGKELRAVNLRIEEMEIQDINFLHGCKNPTLIIVHQDNLGRHIKTHEICLNEKEFIKVPWKQDNIEREASMIIPVPEPLCGAIIIGQESILYHDGKSFLAVSPHIIRYSAINCFAYIDTEGKRYILGDMAGHLFLLFLEIEKRLDSTFTLKDIKVELLGEVSTPECITYLDNGVLFIGSRIGDSQLIKLDCCQNNETGTYITVLETFPNIGPIVDMAVVDLERQGQSQLVTCSGGFKEGSLRIIRNGIGIQENANIDLPGIKGIWSLNSREVNDYDDLLILSFFGYTRVLSLTGDELEEIEVFGFNSDKQTLLCSKVLANVIFQVTPQHIALISIEPPVILSEWKICPSRSINMVAASSNHIVCTSGNEIIFLEICNNQIVERNQRSMQHEVSCIDIIPLHEETYQSFIAVGLWNDISVRILSLPSLEEVHCEYLGGETLIRSVLFASFEGIDYLFCALGDGCLFYFLFDQYSGRVMDRKRVTLGTQPLVMRTFKSIGSSNIFVCSDRPTVIYSAGRKLVFSNVNLKEVNHICSLNTESYPDSLTFANDCVLSIGTIDEIQKLHIRSIPLFEGPRRIAYQESTQTFGVITTRLDIQGPSGLEMPRECASSRAPFSYTTKTYTEPLEEGAEVEIHHMLLFDQHTFEVLFAYQMLHSEFALSLISCSLGNDNRSYYVVGTGLVYPEETEPKFGRILVFQVEDGRLVLVCEKNVKGGCYSLAEFNRKLLASVNSTVRLFEWTAERELRHECSHFNNIIALFVKTKGDFVLVGDLMRAVTLLQYKTLEGSFEEIARDYNPNWMTAIEILDDDTFLGAENSFNLFVCQKDSTATCDEDREIMQEVGQFHLGDMVNMFRRGSLVRQPLCGTTALSCGNSILFGTVSGAVGIVTHISRDLYELLNELQCRLSKGIQSVGRIEHAFWRSFCSEVKTEAATGFIDGELIECFLDMPRSEMERIVKGLLCPSPLCCGGAGDGSFVSVQANEEVLKVEITVDTVVKIVEDLTRFH